MMHKVGERISLYRKERNLSQEELATVLNVSRQTISKWETGDTLPDVYNAVALASLFHVSLDALILGNSLPSGQTSYIQNLKEKRQKMNLWAIVVGSFGSLSFGLSLVLSDAFELEKASIGILMAIIFPILMFCWAFAIWRFIKISRINDEIKYLEKIELLNVQNKFKQKNSEK